MPPSSWGYTYSMTMTRNTKASHQFELHIATQNSGYVAEEWARPTERYAAIAATGHALMPVAEYRAHRMGRKVTSRDRRDVVIRKIRARRRAR